MEQALKKGIGCLCLLCLSVLMLGGCGTWYSGLRGPVRGVSEEYATALKTHTRKGWRTQGLDRVVSVTATVQTSDLLEVMALEQSRLSLSAPEQAGRKLAGQLAGEGTSVVLFIEALEQGWERLDRGEPVWRILLEVEGARYEPSRVTALDARSPTVRHLYPYMNRFGRAWLLVFDVDEVGDRPVLWMMGAPAQLRLEFAL